MRVEDSPDTRSSSQSAILPSVRIPPYVLGSFGKAPNRNSLVDFQEPLQDLGTLPEKIPADFTPLPADFLKSAFEGIGTT